MGSKMNIIDLGADAVPVVFVIDDDDGIRLALTNLFESMRFEVAAFSSPADFLQAGLLHRHGCIVLDVRLPGINGLDFQSHLAQLGCMLPVIFVTGHADVAMSVRAMKAGADDFLTKPFREQDILDAVMAAIQKDKRRRSGKANQVEVEAKLQGLTAREREVMGSIVKGMMNKQIAHQLGISEITVKLHRGNLMRKMQVRSVVELIRAAEIASGKLDPEIIATL